MQHRREVFPSEKERDLPIRPVQTSAREKGDSFTPESVRTAPGFLQSCAIHDHLCLIYENQDEQLAITVPFIRSGLERGEKCLYIVDENTAANVMAAMRADGIDVDTAVASGALSIVSSQDSYLKQGRFDPDWMIVFLNEALEAAEKEGYPAFRVTGEMTWALGNPADLNGLIEYETKLNEFFPAHNILAICQYNRLRFPPEVLLEVIHAHPRLLCDGLACENPNYIPPEVFYRTKYDPAAEVQRLLDGISQNARLQLEREQYESALRESAAEREADLEDARLLQSVSAEIIRQQDVHLLYEKIVDSAVRITRSDFASMQMFYRERGKAGELRLLAFRGFNPEAVKFWEWVHPDSESTCGEALRTGRRSVVTDVEQCGFMAGTGDLTVYRNTGIRAIQSTPLFSRSGELVGMISTHWRQPHEPTERDLRLMDILARQAADLIEHKQGEEALRFAHDELEFMVEQRTSLLRKLTSRLAHAQDEERRRIARELHDSIGQYLVAVKMNLAQLDSPLLASGKAQLLAEAAHLVDECLSEIRTISYLLHPPLLDESGLSSAMRWYVEGFAKRSSIEINLDLPEERERMPQHVELAFFRALQESLTNVHRHSGAAKVDIRLQAKDGQATLVVRDYGRGFASDPLLNGDANPGIGLTGMKERIGELGGIVKISPENPGAAVTVTIPLAQPAVTQNAENPGKGKSAA